MPPLVGTFFGPDPISGFYIGLALLISTFLTLRILDWIIPPDLTNVNVKINRFDIKRVIVMLLIALSPLLFFYGLWVLVGVFSFLGLE